MVLTVEEQKVVKRLLEREIEVKGAGRKSVAGLSKKERAVVPSIASYISVTPEKEEEFKYNRIAKSVIEKVASTRIRGMAEVVIPAYEQKKAAGEKVEDYIQKSLLLIELLKGLVNKCQS